MIHSVYFKDGHVQYKNRWVETNHLKTERQFDRTIYGSVGKLLEVPQEVIDAGALKHHASYSRSFMLQHWTEQRVVERLLSNVNGC